MARVQMDALQKHEAAAQSGQSEALYNLGLVYATGKGVDVDLITAHKWFNLAAMRGSHAARDIRTEIAQDMSPTEIAEAQRQAREWLSQH